MSDNNMITTNKTAHIEALRGDVLQNRLGKSTNILYKGKLQGEIPQSNRLVGVI